MDLSIIIVSWNVREHLARCLASIRQLAEAAEEGISFEVFVVDNASTDGTADWLAHSERGLQVIHNSKNLGFAAANNQAIQKARGEFILLLNPDTEVCSLINAPPPIFHPRGLAPGGSTAVSHPIAAFPANSSPAKAGSSNSAVGGGCETPSVAVPHYAAEGGSGGWGSWIDALRGWHRVASARLYAARKLGIRPRSDLRSCMRASPALAGRVLAQRQYGDRTPEREVLDRPALQTPYLDPLQALLTFMRAHPQCGIAGPMLRNADGTMQPSVRRFPRAWDPILFSLGVTPKKYCMTDFDYTRARQVDQVMGACFLIRRKCLDAIGLLDERFFIWFEEVDYCHRAKKAGWEVWYTPDTSVLHHGGESFAQMLTTKKQWIYSQSLLRYFAKYHAWGAWILNALFVIPRLCIALLLYRNAHHRS